VGRAGLPRPFGLALRVMLTHQPESQAIQSNLRQVLTLHARRRALKTKKAPRALFS